MLPRTAARWLRCRTPRPAARLRLVCFPHAGGAASFYSDWSGLAPADVEVHAVQYPGREDRIADAPPTAMSELVAGVTAEVEALSGAPLVLFGHSMGALVAYEVARELSVVPARLVVSGRHTPDELVGGDVHLRDDEGLVAEVLRVGGAGAEMLASAKELWPVFLPAIRGDYRVEETYRHQPGASLSCPVTAIIGAQDGEVTTEQADRWSTYTSGPFTRHVVPGGHFFPAEHAARVLGLAIEETSR
ncbi:thioesterase II family protein [Saccharopolyspora spinosa]|uniref:Pyochelin biosynthetic protein PchC n=1 Tax=Saccharopolyspora spinosa TaxID=60894 RepID=A0A2N3XUJ7_SACSN|nr:alpha/beta fold hydrolase [Saccharopolyspora spinosa]PKW14319.1 pyochelin biosynthetic protein PchC [Saccharopolyspora spinosa]